MSKKLYYTLCTVILILGFMTLLHGSRMIIQTYQRESLYDEALKTGVFPDDKKAAIFAKRGLKDGLVHILYQVAGATVSIVTCLYMVRKR